MKRKNKKTELSDAWILVCSADLSGSVPVSETPRRLIRRLKNGRLWRAEKNSKGEIVSEFIQMTLEEKMWFVNCG